MVVLKLLCPQYVPIVLLNAESLDIPQDPIKILKRIATDHEMLSSSCEEINQVIDSVIENLNTNSKVLNDSFDQGDLINFDKNIECLTKCYSCQKAILKKKPPKINAMGW